MEKLEWNTGIREFSLGSGVLRFNPTDPNVYRRFSQLGSQLEEICGSVSGADMMEQMAQADEKMKKALGQVFGPGNDFDQILEGVSLFAKAENAQPVLMNLLSALEPILHRGAQECARELLGQEQL